MSDTEQSELPSPFEKSVINIWRSYKDTPQLMAKRRFIALLRDVDVRLLRVKAYQTIPWGFPKTPKGDQICPYSNAKKGCPRPLMDKYGHNLEHELDNNESLSDFEKLKKWLDEVAPQQTCSLGLHTSITAHVGSRFATFFGRPECGGFQPYKPAGHHKMIKKVRFETAHMGRHICTVSVTPIGCDTLVEFQRYRDQSTAGMKTGS